MHERNLPAVEAVMRRPFRGYARRAPVVPNAFLNRVVACVALLGTMLVSGMLLGGPAPKQIRR